MGVYLMLALDSQTVRLVNGHEHTFTEMDNHGSRSSQVLYRNHVYKSAGRLLNGIRT